MDRRRFIPEELLSRAALCGFLAALALGGVACGLFETRAAVEPKDRFPCSTLDEPDNVFLNMRFAYGRGDGLACYLSNLDGSFRFYPDPADSMEAVSADPEMFQNPWDKTLEDQVGQRVAGATRSIVITYKGAYSMLLESPTEQIRRYTYEIAYDGSVISDTLLQGIADVTIRKSTSAYWQVTHWVDRRDPAGTTNRTWGYLRWTHKIGIP